jgi:hypothetical protein
MLLFALCDAEAVKHSVVGSDVDAAICDRQPTEVIERFDFIAAGP